MHLPFTSCEHVVDALLSNAPPGPSPPWLLCVAEAHADALVELLRQLRGRGLRVCGGVFPGLLSGAERLSSGLIAIALPQGTRLALADLAHGLAWREPLPALSAGDEASSIILVDCRAPGIARLLEDVFDHCGPRAAHAGAGAGFHDLRAAPCIFTEEGLHAQAALVLLMPRRSTVSVRHGWHRVRGPFVATRTRGNVIEEINWESAGRFYRQAVAEQDAPTAASPVFADLGAAYPLSLGKEGGEDVIRDPVRVTDADELLVLSDVSENSVMYLAHGDRGSLIQAARQAVQACRPAGRIERVFVADCISRTAVLGEDFGRELQAVDQALSELTAVAPEGVLALGEIAAAAGQPLEFFNKTFVVALVEAPGPT